MKLFLTFLLSGRFIPFNLNELEDLCGLFNTIIDHIQETIGTSETSFIKDSCTVSLFTDSFFFFKVKYRTYPF